MLTQEQYIQRCFELAQLAKGYVTPNPLVGAILVHNGRIIGEGYHKKYGQAHAEIDCLNSVQEEDKQHVPESTMYVSLEPCAHHGKTPPCANRLVQEKVKKVVICNKDPFDQVAGRGIDILQANGVKVTQDILQETGRWVNRRFFCYHELKRPYIILKWAQTQDGFIAPANKERFGISNKNSQQLVHKWRTEEDAIIVGYNTAMNDNPQLTARLWKGNQPLRIAIDRKLSLPTGHHLFDSTTPTWILNDQKEEKKKSLNYVQVDFEDNIITQLLTLLYNAGKQSLIVEGGAVLLQHFIQMGLWDETRVLTGNKKLLDGIAAPTLSNAAPVLTTAIVDDTLDLYTNPKTKYPYVAGQTL